MALKDWTRKKPSGTKQGDIFWHKEDMLVTVGQSLGTKEWFTFIDGGSNVKVRTEFARNKGEAIRFAKAYMRKH